jgi:hypothetical protein
MNEVHFFADTRKVKRLGKSAIPSSDDRNTKPTEKIPIASSAIRNASTKKFFLTWDTQLSIR